MRNVKHVPNLKRNLISIGQLANRGMKATFYGDAFKIMKDAMEMAHTRRKVSST